MKKLVCHTELIIDGEVHLTEGRAYDVIHENEHSLDITNDIGNIHVFTIEEDKHGDNYATWFNIVGE